MDSQLATVLTSGSLNVQNGSQCTQTSGSLSEVCLDPDGEDTSPCTGPGKLQPCPVQIALTIRQDSLSINGKKPEVGGTPKAASQETSKIGGFREPIIVKTGVPILHREPIRIRIVVPPHCKRPITNSTISLTKDLTLSLLKKPVVVSAGAESPDENKSQTCAVNCDIKEETCKTQPSQCADADKTETQKEKDVSEDKNIPADVLETPLISGTSTVKIQKISQPEIKEENNGKNGPVCWEKTHSNSSELKHFEEEQIEPLDLSLPGKKEKREKRCGRLLDDFSSFIMEVDEYEGDGDRDIVEEDDTNREVFCVEEPLLSPSILTSDILDSLIDSSTEDLLLIDDQGIPYTLSPDGLKLPQVDISKLEQNELMDTIDEVESTEEETPSQSLDDTVDATLDEPISPPSSTPHLPVACEDAKPVNHSIQEGNANLSPLPSGISVPSQPFQILTNSSNNILFLSSSSSSPQAPISLSLPLAQATNSTPMLLFLSPVPSSTGESTPTSTPIAVLDPLTGQVSQITTTAAPLAQVGTAGAPLSHPVIRLSSSNIILSGSTVISSLALSETDQNSSNTTLAHNTVSSSTSTPGTEAIFAEEVLSENKPLTVASSLTEPEAEVQSPSSDTKPDLSDQQIEHLSLKDHLYHNCAPPPSPPLITDPKLEPLDPLDPLSPDWTPDGAARRVLYCQLCPRVFFYLSDLERHAITHSQKKPHVCPQCGKAFKRSSHLQRHKHIHTGQRNFVCPICSKRFREAGELQRHQRVHTGEKPYQCQLCHTRFAERNTLRRHTKRKHPYHQVAMEMLNEKKNGGGRGGAVQEEESAEWYSSSVTHMDNSESETEA